VLLSLYNVVFPWLRDHGLQVPRDVGVIQLEWRESHTEISGMNQHNDAVGAAAVDMVVGQIHRNETGIPAFPRATHIGASWVDGQSVRRSARRKTGSGTIRASSAPAGPRHADAAPGR